MGGVLLVLLGSAGCETPAPPDPSQPTAAEREACDQTIDLGCDPFRTDREACATELVELRLRVGQPPCDDEYDAWIECLLGVTECLTTPGVFCPDEYGAPGMCSAP